ncbi:MAG: hypothetical protein ACYDDF_05075 [Thermoplasmatota archaeon]
MRMGGLVLIASLVMIAGTFAGCASNNAPGASSGSPGSTTTSTKTTPGTGTNTTKTLTNTTSTTTTPAACMAKPNSTNVSQSSSATVTPVKVTYTIDSGCTTTTVTLKEVCPQSAPSCFAPSTLSGTPGMVLASCAVALKDANGTAQGTSDCTKAITAAVTAKNSGMWTLAGNFSAAPGSTLQVSWAAS